MHSKTYLCTEKYIFALKNIFVHWKIYSCTDWIYLCTGKLICSLKNICALKNIFVHWKTFVHWKIYLCTEKHICALKIYICALKIYNCALKKMPAICYNQYLCIEILWATVIWRFHTELCKFLRNISTNICGLGKRTDVKLGEVFCLFISNKIIISWIYLLNGFRFIFWLRDSENDLQSLQISKKKTGSQFIQVNTFTRI